MPIQKKRYREAFSYRAACPQCSWTGPVRTYDGSGGKMNNPKEEAQRDMAKHLADKHTMTSEQRRKKQSDHQKEIRGYKK